MSTPLPLTLRVLRQLSEVPEAAWDALVAEDAQAQPFLYWRFLHALEQSGSVGEGTGWRPRHLTLWRGRRLVAAAPAYLKDDSHGEFVFDWSWATAAERVGVRYYPKLVLAVPFIPATGRRLLVLPGEDRAAREAELARAALEWARSQGLSGVHALFPTEAEAGALEAAGWAVRLGVQYHWHNAGYASLDDFLARFPSKRRTQLRRELRAPAEQGLVLRTVRGEALAGVDPRAVHRLYASTLERYGSGPAFLTEELFRWLLLDFREHVEVVEARGADDGRLVACAFNVRGPGVLYGRYWGCAEEHPFLHFNVCLYHPVREAIAQGLARVEPGAGGEHKLVRGFEPSLTWSAHLLLHPGLDRAVRDFLHHERAAVRKGLPLWRAEAGLRHAPGSVPAPLPRKRP